MSDKSLVWRQMYLRCRKIVISVCRVRAVSLGLHDGGEDGLSVSAPVYMSVPFSHMPWSHLLV
jgi:hypothetical protein